MPEWLIEESDVGARVTNGTYRKIVPLPEDTLCSTSIREAMELFSNFHQSIPERVRELPVAANEDGLDAELWNMCCESMGVLGSWMDSAVATMPLTDEEWSLEKEKYPWYTHTTLDKWKFTPRTLSLINDWGIYYGETIRRIDPSLKWELITKPRKSIDYHQPVIAGYLRGIEQNPFRKIRVVCRHVVDGRKAENMMVRLYQIDHPNHDPASPLRLFDLP
ncbi:MAG: hypothetical protein ABJA67_00760 [Chthonomonadales bacterium]